MSVRIRITNESAFTHGEVRVQLFQGPRITEGEHGIAQSIETRALSVGESHAFTLEDGMYISAEEPNLKAGVTDIPTHLPVFVLG
jgi:hypothetical protein